MHSRFGSQLAECIFAPNLNCRTFDAGHLSLRALDQFGTEALILSPSKIHAQQHIGPILRFGSS